MSSEDTRQSLQFSLRSFLFAVLIVGPIAGVAGPMVLEAITEWKPPPRPLPPRAMNYSTTQPVDSESYYESGETPLY